MHRLPVASSRNIESCHMWLGRVDKVLGLSSQVSRRCAVRSGFRHYRKIKPATLRLEKDSGSEIYFSIYF